MQRTSSGRKIPLKASINGVSYTLTMINENIKHGVVGHVHECLPMLYTTAVSERSHCNLYDVNSSHRLFSRLTNNSTVSLTIPLGE